MNQTRDARNINSLRTAGWDVLELWECDVRRWEEIEKVLREFLIGTELIK